MMIVSRTPLRISLFGGGTDFPDYYQAHGGVCLSTAINKYVYVVVKTRYDNRLRLSYTQTETVDDVADLKHSLIREALKLYQVRGGLEIATMADIPGQGSGLASSSAVTVGTLNALRTAFNWTLVPDLLAKHACIIENDLLRQTPGQQDQYICAYGGFKIIRFVGRSVTVMGGFLPSVLAQLEKNLMLFYTGQTRQAETILTRQNERNGQNIQALHHIKRLAYDAIYCLHQGNTDAVGELLDVSWQHKKSLCDGITNEAIDRMYELAREGGALGGKICGAGGGGYLLVYVPEKRQDSVRLKLADYQELKFKFEPMGSMAKRVY
jgi:D-glycero-alpha-D-manno-heptose-7-phosphate kinase